MSSPRPLLCLLCTLVLSCQSPESRPPEPDQALDASESEQLAPDQEVGETGQAPDQQELHNDAETADELPELQEVAAYDEPEGLDVPEPELDDQEQDLPGELDAHDALDLLDDELSPELDTSETLEPPVGLQHWLLGNALDVDAQPLGPALILMGGGEDVDAAFSWWAPLLDGGDVVVLRASGADGYNDYLLSFGPVDSVHTLLIDSSALAHDPWVTQQLDGAEGIFIAGGDQADYLRFWSATPLAEALQRAAERGAVLGGTSAGCAILSEYVFGALQGTVYSDEALADPYNPWMTLLKGPLALPLLHDVLNDTHFRERDRMGRLAAFLARLIADGYSSQPLGLGIDEGTALLIDAAGVGIVRGTGSVYVLRATRAPERCVPKQSLSFSELSLWRLQDGDSVALPGGSTSTSASTVSVVEGLLVPANPYDAD